MIKDGFTYIALLVFLSGFIVSLPKIFTSDKAKKIFKVLSPVTLIYLGLMILCTLKIWDLSATQSAYSSLRNPLLYTMIFLMLLRCDMKKIIKLGPKMLIGFFAASISISLGFVVSFAIFKNFLGVDAYKALGALCGSWMGGTGNMLAIQSIYEVSETNMVFALVTDSVIGSVYVMFLLWAIGEHALFNSWTKANTNAIDEVGNLLALESEKTNKMPLVWQNILFLIGSGLFISALSLKVGSLFASMMPFFDKTTWTVLVISLFGVLLALTPLGKLRGIEEVSNCLLYSVIALVASRADLSSMVEAPMWIVTGFVIMLVHVLIMILLAKLLKMDMFTCCVASLANVGGTATAPVLAGAYSSALVPVAIVMALLGYIVGTGGGLITTYLMSLFI